MSHSATPGELAARAANERPDVRWDVMLAIAEGVLADNLQADVAEVLEALDEAEADAKAESGRVSTRFELRLDPETDILLDTLARDLGVSRAAVIKMALRELARGRTPKR